MPINFRAQTVEETIQPKSWMLGMRNWFLDARPLTSAMFSLNWKRQTIEKYAWCLCVQSVMYRGGGLVCVHITWQFVCARQCYPLPFVCIKARVHVQMSLYVDKIDTAVLFVPWPNIFQGKKSDESKISMSPESKTTGDIVFFVHSVFYLSKNHTLLYFCSSKFLNTFMQCSINFTVLFFLFCLTVDDAFGGIGWVFVVI